ncbi:vitamin K epoxide reductase complex subunit 1-like [Oculina patagonica]
MAHEALLFSDSFDHMLFCCLGILVSAYALYVETRKHKDSKYKAACDLGENMSCSRVLTSSYSKGFGVVEVLLGKEHFLNMPNCILGIVFYSSQLVLGILSFSWIPAILFMTSVVSCVGSAYLAFILFFVLKDLCLVCIATYVVNGALLYLNYHRYFA